jgi:hypothetical protein
MTAHIPFDFNVGNLALAQGDYQVARAGPMGVIQVRSEDWKAGAFSTTYVQTNLAADAVPTLVFRKYGDRHFLGEIWIPKIGMKLGVPKSKQERELVTSTFRAGLRPETVIILACR